nr:unnamed protein product [Callosobruchus analis]
MERSEALSKPKKRKSSSRPLTDEELEAVTYPADVSKEDECDPFSSDDTVVDENYDPNNDESGDSSSSDEDNNSPSVGCQVEAKLVHGPNNSDDEWTDAEEDPEAFPFLSKDDINISIPFDATPLQYFQPFFDDSMINIIIEETNRRGREDFDGAPVSTRKKKKMKFQKK